MNRIMKENKGIVRWFYVYMGLIVIMAAFLGEMNMAQSELVMDEIFSPSLEGNLLGDPATRPMAIYLPPSYDSGDRLYPVVYLLHGANVDHRGFSGIDTIMDELIQQGQAQEMILVMPHANNRYNGSHYANSSVSGNYEDYITQDLVRFIDGRYRTLPQRESRAVAGQSMGGSGAMYLAMKYPEVYCAVVSESGPLSFNRWIDAALHDLRNESFFQGIAIAYSPNPDSPLLYDYPTDDEGNLRDDVWQRWLEHLPVNMVSTHQENLKQLAGIYFGHGIEDTIVPVFQSQDFDRALTEAGIPHVYEEYHGGHANPARLKIGLTFLSNLLSSNILTPNPVQPKNKLATTWGEIRNSN